MSHSHNHSEHDYVAGNRAYFDETFAAKYDEIEGAVELPKRILPFILAEYPLDVDRTTVLDYACGTGLLSGELVPVTKSILGVDISQAMVDQYNLRVSNHNILPEKMTAICVELKGEEGELDNKKFDVVVCSMAYHHFSDINKTTSILTDHLNPSGKLFVVDLKLSHEHGILPGGLGETMKDVVAHVHGMSEEALKSAFEGAGLKDFGIKDAGNIKLLGRELGLVVATGTKY